MSFFLRFRTHEQGMDRIVSEIMQNMSNNYKDAAGEAFGELQERFGKLEAEGELNDRQKSYYGEIIESFRERLKGYSHKDQKPYWSGK